MRRQENLGAVINEVLQGGDGCADTSVIADVLSIVHGHVKVGAHKHALALYKQIASIRSQDSLPPAHPRTCNHPQKQF